MGLRRLRRVAFVLFAVVALAGAGCSSKNPRSGAFERGDMEQLVLQPADLTPPMRVVDAQERPIRKLVEQFPSVAGGDLRAVFTSLIALGPDKPAPMVSIAIVANNEDAARRTVRALRSDFVKSVGPGVTVSPLPDPEFGDEPFAYYIDSASAGYAVGWRLSNAVLMLQIAKPEGVDGDDLIQLLRRIHTRADTIATQKSP